jgi:NAD-dependent DNA ligase
MVLVKDLEFSELGSSLDPRFFEVVPQFCESCESPLNMNMALTELKCINPMCTGKLVMRVRKLCEALGIKHFGESSIEKWVDENGIVSPLQLYNIEDGMLLNGISDSLADKLLPQISAVKTMKLWEFVANAQLPYIQMSAKKLLEGYSSLEDFFRDMTDGGVDFIQTRLGIGDQYDDFGNPIVSTMAAKVFTSLLESQEELLEAINYINLEDESNVREFIIVASDEVGNGFSTKREFYNYIKQRYAGLATFTIGSSVTKKTNVVIWKGFDGTPARETSKVKRTYELHAQGIPIQGYTAEEFIEAFDKLFGLTK